MNFLTLTKYNGTKVRFNINFVSQYYADFSSTVTILVFGNDEIQVMESVEEIDMMLLNKVNPVL